MIQTTLLGAPIVTILAGVRQSSRYREINRLIRSSMVHSTGMVLNDHALFPTTDACVAMQSFTLSLDDTQTAMIDGFTHSDLEGHFLPASEKSILCLRMQDYDNYYGLRWQAGKLEWVKVENGVSEVLSSVSTPSPFPNKGISWKLEGDSLTASVMGVASVATDAAYASGDIGFVGAIGKIAIA